MAAWQDEIGKHCVTGVVSLAVSDEGSDVHFEAFQVGRSSAHMLDLWCRGASAMVIKPSSQLLRLWLSDGLMII